MILEALMRLAEREDLIGDPSYEYVRIACVIHLNEAGQLVRIEDLRYNSNEGKVGRNGKPLAKRLAKPTLSVPRQAYRSGESNGFLLADTSRYIFGISLSGDNSSAAKCRGCTERYRAQIKKCADDTKDPGVVAVVKFLRRYPPGKPPADRPKGLTPGDQFVFKVNGQFVHASLAVRRWWRATSTPPPPKRKRIKGAMQIPTYRCVVTGKEFHQLDRFPASRGAPGASEKAKLVSMDKRAYWSHGWKRNENAPICGEASLKIATALTRLLDTTSPKNANGDLLPRRNMYLPGPISFCYWVDQPGEMETALLDQLPSIMYGRLTDPKSKARGLIEQIWRGEFVTLPGSSEFYAMMVSGAMTRITIRSWLATDFNNVLANLSQHFRDMRTVYGGSKAAASDSAPETPPTEDANATEEQDSLVPSLGNMMRALAPVEQKNEQAVASTEAAFLRAAFGGIDYPAAILAKALQRNRAEIAKSSLSRGLRMARFTARAWLIKAVLNRRRRLKTLAANRYQEVSYDMNPQSCDQTPYCLGVLLAVLDRLQVAAMNKRPNTSIIDHYYGAASCTPRAVFPRLLKLAKHHAQRAEKADGGRNRLVGWRCTRLISWLVSRISADHGGFPAIHNMEEQGLFTLGYHHMNYWMWMNKEERQTWEQNHPDVPDQFVWSKKTEGTNGSPADNGSSGDMED